MPGTLIVENINDGTANYNLGNLSKGAAKAWVAFNGTGTVAVMSSYNIASITDNAVGMYTLNFLEPMKNINYAYSGAGRWNGANSALLVGQNANQAKTLSSLPIHVSNSTTGGAVDMVDITVIVHGD